MTRSLLVTATTALCLAAACAPNANDESAGGTVTEPGLTTAGPASGSSQPSQYQRPWDFQLDGLDPCTLVTPAQQREAGVKNNMGAIETNGEGDMCFFEPLPDQIPAVGYNLILAVNVEYQFDVLLSPEGASLVTAAGFPAVLQEKTGAVGAFPCRVYVPTFDAHYLWIELESHDEIPMETACAMVKTFAAMAVETLETLR